MLGRKLIPSSVDMSDTKTKVVLGVAAAGAALAVGGAVYYMSRGGEEEEKKSDQGPPVVQKATITPTESEIIVQKTELTPLEKAEKTKSKGTDSFKKSEYSDAIKFYLEAVDLYPDEESEKKSLCYQNIAAASEKLGRIDDVVKYCSQALSLNKKYVKALLRRAMGYEKLKRYAESIKDLTAVCLLEGPQKSMKAGHMNTSDRVLKLYGEEQAKIVIANRVPTLPSHTVISAAFDNIHMRDFHSSVDPETLDNAGDKLYLTVLSDIEKKDYAAALGNLYKAQNAQPAKFLGHVLCLRGIFAWLMTDTSKAIECFNAVIGNPESYLRIRVQALIHRGEVYQSKGDRPRANMDYNAAVALDEDHPDPYLHRAQFYLSLESLEPALKDLKKCISLDEEFPAPWSQLVYGEYQMARTINTSLLDQVFTNLGKMVDKFPNVADVYALYGQVLQDQKQFAAAEEKFLTAQRLAPDNVTFSAHIATLKMMAENNYDSALELLTQAIERDPKCDFVLENLGMIYIQKQMYKEALECFGNALKLVKTEAEAAHVSSLYIGIKCQWEVCEEYGVKPVSISDFDGYSEMMTTPGS